MQVAMENETDNALPKTPAAQAPFPQNLAILSTSDIMVTALRNELPEFWEKADYDAKYQRKHIDDVWIAWSTGVLERAISEGYTVYIVTLNEELAEHDGWWLLYHDSGEIEGYFLSETGLSFDRWMETNPPLHHSYDFYRNRLRMNAWRKLFDKLGLSYPLGLCEDPAHWTQARDRMHELGAKIGADFRR